MRNHFSRLLKPRDKCAELSACEEQSVVTEIKLCSVIRRIPQTVEGRQQPIFAQSI